MLFVANDGASVGHVTRSVAVATALRQAAGERVEVLLATTSLADGILSWAGLPAVRLPAFGQLPEETRRALVTQVLRATVDAFRPDLLVVDTFPSGPHLELAPVLERVRWKVLVRRTLRPERAHEAVAAANLGLYDRVLVPDDPLPLGDAPVGAVRVPPIVLPVQVLARPAEHEGVRILVACGGRGDPQSAAVARAVVAWCAATGAPAPVVVDGLLDRADRPLSYPLLAHLRAFDAAVISAGYNSAHECASVGLPAVLYGRERAFDDQLARAARFAAAGFGVVASGPQDVAEALPRALSLAPPPLACDGAARSAAALLDLVGAA